MYDVRVRRVISWQKIKFRVSKVSSITLFILYYLPYIPLSPLYSLIFPYLHCIPLSPSYSSYYLPFIALDPFYSLISLIFLCLPRILFSHIPLFLPFIYLIISHLINIYAVNILPGSPHPSTPPHTGGLVLLEEHRSYVILCNYTSIGEE